MKKIIAIFVSAAMLVSMLPMMAFAATDYEIPHMTDKAQEALVEQIMTAHEVTYEQAVEAKNHIVSVYEKYQDDIKALHDEALDLHASVAEYFTGGQDLEDINAVIDKANVILKHIQDKQPQVKADYEKYIKPYLPEIEKATGCSLAWIENLDLDFDKVVEFAMQMLEDPEVQAYIAQYEEKAGMTHEEAVAKVQKQIEVLEDLVRRLQYANYGVMHEGKDFEAIEAKFAEVQAALTLTNAEVKVFKTQGKKNRFTVFWNAKDGVKAYQVAYGKKGTSKSKVVNVPVKDAKQIRKTIGKLKKGTTYRVRVRAVVTVDGENYYSNWSVKKFVTVK